MRGLERVLAMIFPPWGRLRRHADALLSERDRLAGELAQARREREALATTVAQRDRRVAALECDENTRFALTESLPSFLARTDLQRAQAIADRLRAQQDEIRPARD